MRKIRKGDQVIVLSGRDKGRRGAVLQVLADGRVLIESVNMVKKHTKPNPQAGKQGGIIEKEMPLAISKVAIWNPGAKKADRIGIKTLADGKQKPADKHAEKPAEAHAGKEAAGAHRAADERPSGPPRLQQFYREQVI